MHRLLAEIVNGDRTPGSVIEGHPSEDVLDLWTRGLCELHDDGTAVVREPYCWNSLDPDVVQAMLADRAPADVADVIGDVIAALQPLQLTAARIAADQASVADIARMRYALEDLRMESVAGPGDVLVALGMPYATARAAVHRVIARASGRAALRSAAEPVIAAVQAIGIRLDAPLSITTLDLVELREIVEAIEAREPQLAGGLMSAHLRSLTRRTGGAIPPPA